MDQEVQIDVQKWVLVGLTQSGKSRFSKQIIRGHSKEEFPTLNAKFETLLLKHSDGKQTKVQLWDTAGQIKYQEISSSHLRRSNHVLIFFDVKERKSFEQAIEWYKLIPEIAPEAKITFVANKIELPERYAITIIIQRDPPLLEVKEKLANFVAGYAEISVLEKKGLKELLEQIIGCQLSYDVNNPQDDN
ncbi:hypothetical protein pb186bvf_020899 [Paramecium bursaria]